MIPTGKKERKFESCNREKIPPRCLIHIAPLVIKLRCIRFERERERALKMNHLRAAFYLVLPFVSGVFCFPLKIISFKRSKRNNVLIAVLSAQSFATVAIIQKGSSHSLFTCTRACARRDPMTREKEGCECSKLNSILIDYN